MKEPARFARTAHPASAATSRKRQERLSSLLPTSSAYVRRTDHLNQLPPNLVVRPVRQFRVTQARQIVG